MGVMKEILRQQKIYWNGLKEFENSKKEYEERQKAKFNRSLIEMMHEPKGVEK